MSLTMCKPFRKRNAEGSAPPWLNRIPPDAPPVARQIVSSIIGMAYEGRKSEQYARVREAAGLIGEFVVRSIEVLDNEDMRIQDRSVSRLTPIIRAQQNRGVKQSFDKRTVRPMASDAILDEAEIWEGFDKLKEYPDDLSAVSTALTEALQHPAAPFHKYPTAVMDAQVEIRHALREHKPQNPVLS